MCSWIEGPNAFEADVALSTPLTVGALTTPTTPRPAPLKLRLGTVTASRRHGIAMAGSTAAAFTGRLAARASCGSSTTHGRVRVRKGRFSIHFGLPKGCRGTHTCR